jgi:hypothetical protein
VNAFFGKQPLWLAISGVNAKADFAIYIMKYWSLMIRPTLPTTDVVSGGVLPDVLLFTSHIDGYFYLSHFV